MSRRQVSLPNQRPSRKPKPVQGSRALVAGLICSVVLAAGVAAFLFTRGSWFEDEPASPQRGPHDRADTARSAGSEAPSSVDNPEPARGEAAWPLWDLQEDLQGAGNAADGGFAGAEMADAGAAHAFGAEVVIPVIPPPGEAPTHARDTGLTFSSGGDPASSPAKENAPSEPAHESAANDKQGSSDAPVASAAFSTTLPVALHERTAPNETPPERPPAYDTGLVFSDAPAPAPKR
jgi:hypothetical protein